jgi:hypothetical protein
MDIQSCSSEDLDAINERVGKAKMQLATDRVETVDVEVLKSTEAAIHEINELHARMNELAKDALQKAIRIGELLTRQRKICKHGEWLAWLKANVQFEHATASRYIGLYKSRDKLLNVRNLSEAYRLVPPKPGAKKKKAPKTAPLPIRLPNGESVVIEKAPLSWSIIYRSSTKEVENRPQFILCSKCWTWFVANESGDQRWSCACDCKDSERVVETGATQTNK